MITEPAQQKKDRENKNQMASKTNDLKSAFGRIKQVIIKDASGNPVKTLSSKSDFESFVSHHKDDIDNYQHELILKKNSHRKSARNVYQKSISRVTGKNPQVFLSSQEDPMSKKKKSTSKKSRSKRKLPSLFKKWRTSPDSPLPPKRKSKVNSTLKGNHLKKLRQIEKKPESRWLTKEQIEYAASTDPATRSLIFRKARKMHKDPSYRAKQLAQQEEKKGYWEGKLAGAQKRSSRRLQAATSPWWKAWFSITNNLGLLLGIVIALSIVFIPVGLFYVIGWSLAVAVVTIVMFVIWVFMEVWYLIAQGLIALINFLGQLITGLFNFIGGQSLGSLGFDFETFDHSLVENLPLADGSGTWGSVNLIPPSFLKLDSFMPSSFDTDTILAKLLPSLSDMFHLLYDPIAQRYLDWIATAEWYYVGAIIGIPVLAVIGVIAFVWLNMRKRWI